MKKEFAQMLELLETETATSVDKQFATETLKKTEWLQCNGTKIIFQRKLSE